MNLEEAHKRLYKRLPDMICKEGCTDCCGPVPFSKWEADNAKAPYVESYGLNCIHIFDGKCSIYENRPFMCRLYGTTENLKCPHGCQPSYQITEELAQELTQKYVKLMESK